MFYNSLENKNKGEITMKKTFKLLSVCLISVMALTACGGDAAENNASSTGSNVIRMSGSTSMEKFANTLKETYLADTGIEIDCQFTGSGAGIQAVTDGTVDIGNSSRALSDEEKAAGIAENIVALDGIGIITDKANTVDNITKEDLAKIYTGEIKNWNELGGSNSAIVVIGREAGSGTRGAFEEILGIEDKCVYAQEINSTGAVMAKVASTPGAIGYVSLDVIDDTVNCVKIDGITANADNIKNGSYALQRPFVMATKGSISEQKQEVQDLFSYIKSDKGQEIIANVGLVSAE